MPEEHGFKSFHLFLRWRNLSKLADWEEGAGGRGKVWRFRSKKDSDGSRKSAGERIQTQCYFRPVKKYFFQRKGGKEGRKDDNVKKWGEFLLTATLFDLTIRLILMQWLRIPWSQTACVCIPLSPLGAGEIYGEKGVVFANTYWALTTCQLWFQDQTILPGRSCYIPIFTYWLNLMVCLRSYSKEAGRWYNSVLKHKDSGAKLLECKSCFYHTEPLWVSVSSSVKKWVWYWMGLLSCHENYKWVSTCRIFMSSKYLEQSEHSIHVSYYCWSRVTIVRHWKSPKCFIE